MGQSYLYLCIFLNWISWTEPLCGYTTRGYWWHRQAICFDFVSLLYVVGGTITVIIFFLPMTTDWFLHNIGWAAVRLVCPHICDIAIRHDWQYWHRTSRAFFELYCQLRAYRRSEHTRNLKRTSWIFSLISIYTQYCVIENILRTWKDLHFVFFLTLSFRGGSSF